MAKTQSVMVEAAGREVTVTNPEKVFFPEAGYTKLDLVKYYLAVAEGALRGVQQRPMVLKRFTGGATEEPFFQKRAPANLPPGMKTAHITFPSGRTADLAVCDERGGPRMGDQSRLHRPQPVAGARVRRRPSGRAAHRPRPDARGDVRTRARGGDGRRRRADGTRLHAASRRRRARAASTSTCASSRSGRSRTCADRALALGREVERRVPALATTKWWKEERHGVFIDYNQNARDRTVASAYSVRPLPDARVSCPLEWDEVPDVDPAAFTLATVPRALRRARRRIRRHRRRALLARAAARAGTQSRSARCRATRRGRRNSRRRRASRRASSRAGAGRAEPASGSSREDLIELERHRRRDLVEGAVARRLVRPPAPKRRGVAEALALQVVERHLADQLWTQRAPSPCRGRSSSGSGRPACGPARSRRRRRPSRYGCERVRPSALLLGRLEARRVADVVQHAVVVVQPEQQRADGLALLARFQRKPPTTQSTVRRCLIFSIARTPGWYAPSRALGDDAVEPGALEALEPVRAPRRGRASSA